MERKIFVNSNIEEQIKDTCESSISIVNLYANQKTLDLLTEINHDEATDGSDWYLDNRLEDFIIRVDFRIAAYVLDVYIDGVYTSLTCKIDPVSGQIEILF